MRRDVGTQAGAPTSPAKDLADTRRGKSCPRGASLDVNEHLFVINQMLHSMVVVEHVSVEGADHVGTDRSNHPVEDVPIGADTCRLVCLRACTIGVIVAANDVDVRIGALTAGMMLNQM